MPWTIHFSDDGAEILYSGHTTGAEILQAKERFFTHRFAGDARYLLCDFNEVELFDVGPADVDEIIKQDFAAVASHPDVIEAVVAPKPFQFGMARMWQMRIDSVRPTAHVSRTREDAIAWMRKHGVEFEAASP